MNSSMVGFLIIFSPMMVISMILINSQVNDFIFLHKGNKLNNKQVFIVNICFFIFTMKAAIDYYFICQSAIYFLKIYLIFCWGGIFCLLDISNHWLPWRFTQSFWIAGVLFASIAGGGEGVIYALLSSLTVFSLLQGIRTITRTINSSDGLGLGDVLLISGLFAWFPWQIAACISAGGFLLVALYSLVTRCSRQPYAPGVFIVLGAYVGLCQEAMDSLL